MRRMTLITTISVGVVAASGRWAAAAGPDVVYTDATSVVHHGSVGGIHGYSLGTNTCNIGNQNLMWQNNGTPGIGWNLYRLHDGRFMQIGMSWVKHACCAAAQSGCGPPCNGQGGSVLGAGCMDVYSAGWNSQQGRLGPRSGINAFSGTFSAFAPTTGDAIFKRLQVNESDLDSDAYPGALYFIEGVYVGTDDAANGNARNNVSYKRVSFNSQFNMTLIAPMGVGKPALGNWREHGRGLNQPDPTVSTAFITVPNEGRFYASYKVRGNGDGTWRYEYVIFNLNSDRAAGSFSVPVPAGAIVTNVGFHDVKYHSGEVYNPADWTIALGKDAVQWSSPQTFLENVNANALRWGMMNNYWFDADRPPRAGTLSLGLFKPGVPLSVEFAAAAPRACIADIEPPEGDNVVNVEDLLAVIAEWDQPESSADVTSDNIVNVSDLLAVIAAWGPCK